ncbi:hypothetical protein [Idiomarina sp. HB]|uniref:hypothetical protein n=1 Tax=Idiomarina sp. HB TaxID=3110479 RepID=UPI003A802ECD
MSRFQNVRDIQTRYSLLLQSHFGLRRAESIMFNVAYADKGDHIRLKSTWTKGGKAREIAIIPPEQKTLISELRQKLGARSLIASDRNFKEQLKVYEYETSRVGLDRNHRLRHQFAQERFYEISGYKCPHQGGPSRRNMTDLERHIDSAHRATLSKELGHERTQITSIYIGT